MLKEVLDRDAKNKPLTIVNHLELVGMVRYTKFHRNRLFKDIFHVLKFFFGISLSIGLSCGHIDRTTTRRISLLKNIELIAALGVQGLVIAVTDEVILVMPRERAQEVRELVSQVKTAGQDRHL